MELDANWSDFGTPTVNERSNEQKHGGSYSRKLVADAIYDGIESDPFITTTDAEYSCELWVYPVDTTNVAILVRYGTGGSYYNYIQVHSDLTQNAWNKITFSYTEAAGGALAAFVVSSTQAGTWYVDDVFLDFVKHIEAKYDILLQKLIEANYDILLQKLIEGKYDISFLQKLIEGKYDIKAGDFLYHALLGLVAESDQFRVIDKSYKDGAQQIQLVKI